jgi:hypothetical protein
MPEGVGHSVAFKDSLNGFAVNVFGRTPGVSRLAATTDGGVTWTMRNRPFSSPSMTYISYVPGTEGTYIVTSWANIGLDVATLPGSAITMDGGDTWNPIDNLPHGKASFAPVGQMGWSAGNGNVIYFMDLSVGIAERTSEVAQGFQLEQNYPNPFNPSTVIRFSIPAGVSGTVTLRVYNVLGQEVRALVNDRLQPGSYETTFDARGLASGAYFYRLTAGSFVQTKRLLLIR